MEVKIPFFCNTSILTQYRSTLRLTDRPTDGGGHYVLSECLSVHTYHIIITAAPHYNSARNATKFKHFCHRSKCTARIIMLMFRLTQFCTWHSLGTAQLIIDLQFRKLSLRSFQHPVVTSLFCKNICILEFIKFTASKSQFCQHSLIDI